MRVVLAHRFADHARGFLVRRVVPQPEFHHREQDPALHGLESVPGVGQRPAHDDAHRVVQIAVLDLLDQRQGDDLAEERFALFFFLIHIEIPPRAIPVSGERSKI